MSKLKSVIDFMTKLKADAADIAENFGKEIDAIRNDPVYQDFNIGASVAIAKYADHVTAELQAENAALRAKVAELEKQLDSLSNSSATCGNPDCTPTQVCELFFDGCRS